MNCPKTNCKFHKEGKTNDCKRSCTQSDKCVNHVHYPLFQLKTELMKKASKKLSEIYKP